MKVSVEDRLRAKAPVGAPDECWEFMGARNDSGYGHFRVKDRVRKAHQVAWELANGEPVPEGLMVRHTCDNPPCTNPRHLILGTNAQNMWDMVQRGRCHLSVLSAEDIPKIRARVATGEPHAKIAADFGVDRRTISDINTGRSWGHVA